MSYSVIIKC